MTARISDYVGVCSACFAVVPQQWDKEHAQWHKDRDEPAGSLVALAVKS